MYQPDFPSVPFRLGLYPVVDSVVWIDRLLKAGVRTLQLRIKDKRDSDVEDDVIAAIALGRQYHARLFINDYWQLAIKHQAYGVHLGQEDLETTDLSAIRNAGLRLGVSTHDDMEIDVALAARPSYIALGHVFPTQTKQMPSAPQAGTACPPYPASGRLSDGGDWRHQPRTRAGGTGHRRWQHCRGQRNHPGGGLAAGYRATADDRGSR